MNTEAQCLQLVEQSGDRVAEVDPPPFIGAASRPVLLDIRPADERRDEGAIPGTPNVPLDRLAQDLHDALFDGDDPTDADRERVIVCYCRSGRRSIAAAQALRMMGFPNTLSLRGGIQAWAAAGGELHRG